MIDVYMYCSYSGSGMGYCEATADRREKRMITVGERAIPGIIRTVWTHGGALSVAGCDRDYCYLVVKKMNVENEKKARDEQGRKVYIYTAFGCKRGSEEELADFTRGFFAQYTAVGTAICDMMILADNEIGYTLDFDSLEALIASCTALGRAVRGTKEDGFHIDFTGKNPVSFVALEGTLNYFISQCRLPEGTRAEKAINADVYYSEIKMSRQNLFVPEEISVSETDKMREVQAGMPERAEPERKEEEPSGRDILGKDETETLENKVNDMSFYIDKLQKEVEGLKSFCETCHAKKKYTKYGAAVIAAILAILIICVIKMRIGG